MAVRRLGTAYGPVEVAPGVVLSRVRSGFLRTFLSMCAEYTARTGRTARVTSAYRSPEKQALLYRLNPLKAAPPGRSMHEYGLAIDINGDDADAMVSAGLMGNKGKYPIWRPLMQSYIKNKERWHLEPKGLKYDLVRAAGYQAVRGGAMLALAGAGLLFYYLTKR